MENTESRKLGYMRAEKDIEQMGIEWAKNLFGLRLKCSGACPWFTTGYGEALVDYVKAQNPT